MKTLDKRLKEGIPLSEYYQIKKAEAEIKKHPVVQYALLGGSIAVISEAIYKIINTDTAIMCSTNQGIQNLNTAGNKILGMARGIGYWIVATVMVFQLMKAMINNDRHKVGEIIISGAISFGSLYFVTFILDLIRDTMGGT